MARLRLVEALRGLRSRRPERQQVAAAASKTSGGLGQMAQVGELMLPLIMMMSSNGPRAAYTDQLPTRAT